MRSTPLQDDPSLRAFLEWDGELERKSGDAALYEVWLGQIRSALATRFSKNRGAAQVLSGRYKDLPPDSIFRILRVPEGDLFGENPTIDRNQLLANALKSAREELAKLLGADASQWSWGKLHVVHFRHALDQQSSAKDLLNLGPLGVRYEYTQCYRHGRVVEQISAPAIARFDLSFWDRSWVINTPTRAASPAVHITLICYRCGMQADTRSIRGEP